MNVDLHERLRTCFDCLPYRRTQTAVGRFKVRAEAVKVYAELTREQCDREIRAFRRLLEFTAFRA